MLRLARVGQPVVVERKGILNKKGGGKEEAKRATDVKGSTYLVIVSEELQC